MVTDTLEMKKRNTMKIIYIFLKNKTTTIGPRRNSRTNWNRPCLSSFFFLLINFWPFVPQQHTPSGPSTTKRIRTRERNGKIKSILAVVADTLNHERRWTGDFPSLQKKKNSLFLLTLSTCFFIIPLQFVFLPIPEWFNFRQPLWKICLLSGLNLLAASSFGFFFLVLVNFSCIITRLSVGYTSDRWNPVVMCDVCVLTY